MARIGETDSRWIVSRRSDGKNVQNWHWTEKDLFPWCKGRFEEIFKNYKVASPRSDLTITEVDNVKGDMVICNRKGKTIYVFDVTLKLKWEGKAQSADNEVITSKGTVIVEDISNTESKFKIQVRTDDETAKNRFLREEMQANLSPKIDETIDSVLEEMKTHASPQEQVGVGEIITPPKPVLLNAKPTTTSTTSSTSEPKSSKFSTKQFKQVLSFNVPPNYLYETFVDQQRVCAFTGGPARVENRVGSEFILYDGAVQGIQEELSAPSKIVQKWRFNSWPENHYSRVTLTFEPSGGNTTITLAQKDIPGSDFERTRDGWEVYFWQRIKSLFGWEYKIKD